MSKNAEMTEAVLKQFVEGENWDRKAGVWQHFQELEALPRALRVRLNEMLKLQEEFHDFIHECDYQHRDDCTTEAISYELFTCVALLAWEGGDTEPAMVERCLRTCSSFYKWAMLPAEKRPDRTLEAQAMHRKGRRGTRVVNRALQRSGSGRLGDAASPLRLAVLADAPARRRKTAPQSARALAS